MGISRILAGIAAAAIACATMASSLLCASAADTYEAYLAGSMGSYQQWTVDGSDGYPLLDGSIYATVNGDAQYEASFDITGDGTGSIEFLILTIPFLTTDDFPDLSVTIDEVEVDGTVIDYSTSAAATILDYYETASKYGTRIYLTDSWAGTNVADVSKTQSITDYIKIKFTVSGIGTAGTSNIKAEAAETTATPAQTTDAPANTTAAPAATTKAPTDNAGAGSAKTGVEGVAAVAAILAIAGAAAVIARKKS